MEVLVRASELKQLLQEERERLIKEFSRLLGAEKPDRNLNAKEAAEYLGISISTLYKRLDKVPHKRFGKKLLFSRKELDEIRH
jgi:excisionase family DNA binding protein